MANELQGNAGPSNTGLTTYFVVWNATGQVRLTGGATFGTATAVNRNAGAISATELGTASGVYAADSPAFAAGIYSYALYKRVGGSPAETDTLLAGPGTLDWTGTGPATVAQFTADYAANALNASVNSVLANVTVGGYGAGKSPTAMVLDLADGIETGVPLREATRLMLAALAGKLSGAAGTTVVIRNAVADSKARITATVDSSGNRTAITWDAT